MVEIVGRALSELEESCACVLVSPSGSFLDEWEVPSSARRGILELLSRSPHEGVAFETRAETLSEDVAVSIKAALGAKDTRVYMGLESSDPWVARFSVYKELDHARFLSAVDVLRRHGISPVANVIVGAPFLDPREVIQDAVETVRWALSNGCDECCLFPVHVKKWTQIHWLHQKGLYSPPSLWALVHVLNGLGRELASRIELSWLTSYDAFNVTESPGGCNQCKEALLANLGKFASTSEWGFIEQLEHGGCACRDAMLATASSSREGRAYQAYRAIADYLFPTSWDQAKDAILREELDFMEEIV